MGDRIKDLLVDKNMTQRELADRLYVSESCVSKIVNEHKQVDIGMLISLCDIFNVSADYLLGRMGRQPMGV